MASFTPPSVSELLDRYLRSINAELPDERTTPGSPARLEALALARLVADLHQAIAANARNATPLEADEDGLELWSQVLGIPRKGATAARKAQSLEVRGTVGASVTAGTVLVTATSPVLSYEVINGVAIPLAGVTLADVEAVDTGPATKLAAGTPLRFLTPPSGIETTARLVRDLDEGGDPVEPVGAWRVRMLTRLREGLQGGNRSDFEQWALEVKGVREAYVYRRIRGLGTVGVAVLADGAGASRVPSAGLRDDVAAYLETVCPIGDAVHIVEPIARGVNVEVRVLTLAGSPWDWEDGSEGGGDTDFTVAAWNPSTRRLTFNPGVPSTMQAGDLITIRSATPELSGADGYPALVAAIVDSDEIVVAPYGSNRSVPFTWTPTAADKIYSSSQTAETVRLAILSGYQVGCDGTQFVAGLDALGPANPDSVYGPWMADVIRDRIAASAVSVRGVLTASVISPVADEPATFQTPPNDLKCDLLVPGQVIVRRA